VRRAAGIENSYNCYARGVFAAHAAEVMLLNGCQRHGAVA
jgi:hypothetical protein